MGHRINKLLQIVLPLVVGSFAAGDLIRYVSQNGTTMNPVMSALIAVCGLSTGIIYLWLLIKKAEQ